MRLCRRICVLEERGLRDEAEGLRASELARLLETLRSPSESDDTLHARLDAIFATERERVADAAVLAELLVPMLHPTPRSSSATAPQAEASIVAFPTPKKNPSSADAAPRPRAATGDIADFIDEMIAQESPAVR